MLKILIETSVLNNYNIKNIKFNTVRNYYKNTMISEKNN